MKKGREKSIKPRKLSCTDELASCQDLQFTACARRGVIIGV